MDRLTFYPLVYLASPYSKYLTGIEQAFIEVAGVAAELLKQGVKVYSPIVQTHPMAIHGGLDPLDHSIWLPFDETMLRLSSALAICTMEGWEESTGIAFEIDFFKKTTKPIFFVHPITLTVVGPV